MFSTEFFGRDFSEQIFLTTRFGWDFMENIFLRSLFDHICLCSRLLASNATLPPSSFFKFFMKIHIFFVFSTPFWLNPGSTKQTNILLKIWSHLWTKSEPLCTVTAQPCLCSRLLASNAALPPSWATDIAQQSYQIALAAF